MLILHGTRDKLIVGKVTHETVFGEVDKRVMINKMRFNLIPHEYGILLFSQRRQVCYR
ncbi:MAG: hypothetical protein QOG13_2651 [Sphingomonadales bacterium]|nr:hypothetical protein [Sphingomonadales bacterium]